LLACRVFLRFQILADVFLAEFNSDAVLNTKTLKQAIGASIPRCSVDCISKLKVAAPASTLIAAISSPSSRAARPLPGRAVTVTYKVTVQHTVFSADTLAAELYRATITGTFDRRLATCAAENAAAALRHAYTYELTTESERSEGSGDSSKALSTSEIVAMAVGGFAFLVLIAAAAVHLRYGVSVSAVPSTGVEAGAQYALDDVATEEERELQAASRENAARVRDGRAGAYAVLEAAANTDEHPCPDAEL
jgi:hypothetical protein